MMRLLHPLPHLQPLLFRLLPHLLSCSLRRLPRLLIPLLRPLSCLLLLSLRRESSFCSCCASCHSSQQQTLPVRELWKESESIELSKNNARTLNSTWTLKQRMLNIGESIDDGCMNLKQMRWLCEGSIVCQLMYWHALNSKRKKVVRKMFSVNNRVKKTSDWTLKNIQVPEIFYLPVWPITREKVPLKKVQILSTIWHLVDPTMSKWAEEQAQQ